MTALGDLTSKAVAALDAGRTLVVLPIGAVEQHGPHLPVLTDAIIAEAVVEHALGLRPADGCVFTLPVQTYGKSNEHAGFAGTFSLSATTLGRIVSEIAEGLRASGLRRLLIVNGHGGNAPVLDAAARDVREQFGIVCVVAHPFRFDVSDHLSGEERGLGIHAGEAETSLLLVLAPELVRADDSIAELPPDGTSLRRLPLGGPATAAWLTRDVSTSGTIGDPTRASAEKGRAILDTAARILVQVIDETLALPLPGVSRPIGPVVYGGETMVWGKGVTAGGFVFLSGVEARVDDDGAPVDGVIAQTELCLQRVDERLHEVGATLSDAVKLVWYARERELLPEFFAVRDRWLEERYPEFLRERGYASTVVVAELSYPDVLVEIDCIAYAGS